MGICSKFAIALAGLLLGACSQDPSATRAMNVDLHALDDGGQPALKLGDVAVGRFSPAVKERPASFEPIPARPRCGLPRPSNGAEIVRTYSYGGGSWSPLYSVERRGELVMGSRNTRPARILVTETEKPVFLFLTSYDDRLWIIDVAPGATLDGVAISGYEHQAVLADIDPKRIGFATFRGQSDCTIIPKPRHVRGSGSVAGLNQQQMEKMQDQRREDMKYDQWMASRIGKPTIEYFPSTLAALLVGPRPAQPLQLSSPEGRTVYVSEGAEVFWGSVDDIRAENKKARTALGY